VLRVTRPRTPSSKTVNMLRRRDLLRILMFAAFARPAVARARATNVRRIGVLSPGPTLRAEQYQGVWDPLRDLGWREGENLLLERRWAEGDPERLELLARQLVRLRVEIIVTIGTDATLAARRATSAIPIIMLSAADPVGTGLVANLNRPGGNVTGISMVGPELEAKRVALLREIVPTAQRIAILANPTTAVSGYSRSVSERVLRPLGVQVIFVDVKSADELEASVGLAARQGAQALIIRRDILFAINRERLMNAISRHRLPAVVEDRAMLDPGGLLAYSVDEDDQLKRFSAFIDRVLRGANPADLPVEQPTKFLLAVNLKTAAALGLTIPVPLLLRADEVLR
jgi:putative ABC transport system substrate-binding protein